MGQSHTAAAGKTMDNIIRSCVKQTGRQNVYIHNGSKYMWEMNPKTYADGSIRGTVQKFTATGAVGKGSAFEITGSGKVAKGIGLAALAGGPGVNTAVKKGRFTLQKFEYTGFASNVRRGSIVYVDMGDRHPDPLKKMTWGYDKSGNLVHGDFNGFFTKVGKPQVFEYEVTGRTASEEKASKHAAIGRAIKRGW